MKQNHISKWAALLLTVSSLAASPLLAVNKVVSTDESGTLDVGGSYNIYTGTYPIHVLDTGVYAGRNIAASSSTGYGQRAALRVDGTAVLAGYTADTYGSQAWGVYTTGTIAKVTLTDVAINTYGDSAVAFYATGSGATLTVTGGTATTHGTGNSYGFQTNSFATAIYNDLTIRGTGTRSLGGASNESSYTELNRVNLISEQNTIIYSTGTVVVNSSYLTGDSVGGGAGSNITINDSIVEAAGAVAFNINLSNSSATSGGNAMLTVNGGTVTTAGDDGFLLSLGSATSSTSGTVTVTFNNVDTDAAGGVRLIPSGSQVVNGIVNVIGGSGISGDIINSSSNALTVNLNNSALTGDIVNRDDGALTIILDNHSTGSGGFNGGNLITGGDSAWTFDKDSHINNGENHGVWNIGDYEVTFDNLTNDGTINLNVNSDTGEGGSITITDTADGEGTVHIDATGNGQADPNQVLPGKVTGDGTEHWQWDPIDWGIDQLIKDGDHFIKSGISPAGAVLNSSVAIQQAMWFAQQNSLLKRMGELRYGARASRPLADKDVRVPYHSLIENLWLRSYGQQLNIGSQVAGKAYEQLIYGVDLGTDHKFTISADSDLYVGVYAGYGRSDLNYRTPGADGEINSYYGGLYATWLHSSGFYLDATVKAASVDNDLKAPYGSTQLKASYSDVNLGGSLELGKKFTFADAWFIEPQFQVNYLHILAEDYTAGPMNITASDLDALQLRIGSLFGRTINLTNSGALQPYIKVSGVETISTGGAIRNGYQHTRANTDGARAEVGGGIIWQLDSNNQLHLDYEASFGDKYDKPWGLSAGYRHQF